MQNAVMYEFTYFNKRTYYNKIKKLLNFYEKFLFFILTDNSVSSSMMVQRREMNGQRI